MIKNNSKLVKLIGLVCTLALVLGAVYVPVSLNAFALTIPVTPDETITFGFESEEESEGWNNGTYKERGEDGFGLASYAFSTKNLDNHGNVLGYDWNNDWNQKGGYRLNNKNGVYRLDTNSTYLVKLKITFRTSPSAAQIDKDGTYISLGYGFSGALSGNNVSAMSNTLHTIAVCNGGSWTLTDISGQKTVENGADWHEVAYVFTTPDSFSGDNSLGFFARHNPNFEAWIDDVQVTKLGSNTGIVLAKDEYNGGTTVMLGEIGADAELPELVGREEEHKFLGWYTDADRTVPAESIKFSAETQWVYTKWRAPVTLTFVDALNETKVVLDGFTGDVITYPADPVDTKNNPANFFFGGWFTTELYTQMFETSTFGSSNTTVYAKWIEKVDGFVQDFENYSYSDKVAAAPDSNGVVYYTNHQLFSPAMDKIDDPTNSGRGNVIEYEWDSEMVKVADDPATYNAAADRDSRKNSCITMGDHAFTEGLQYIMYFDYYVEEIGSQNLTMTNINAHYSQGWKYGGELTNKGFVVTSSDKDGKWHTGATIFTMKEANGAGPYVHAIFKTSKNENTKIYLDNFRFVPVQANEVIMTVNKNNGTKAEYVPVVKGAAVDIEVPTFEDRAFKGWYTDSGCTAKFEDVTYPKTNFTVYARWADAPETFQNYPFDTTKEYIFGRNLSIVKGKGVGHGDDAVAKYVLDGDTVYTTQEDGTVVYWASRAKDADSIVKLNTTVAEGEVYKVSFWYKGDAKANVNTTIVLRTASPDNIWSNGKNDTNTITVYPSDTEWKKAEFYYSCSLKAPEANGIFVRFNTTGKVTDLSQLAIAYIDDVLIEKLEKPYILFDALNNKLPEVVQGKVGQTIKAPEVPVKVGMKFVGWYLDKELTEPFTETVFAEGMATTVYAKYDLADNFVINFENMGKGPTGSDDDYLFIRGGLGAVDKMGYNNTKGVVFDRGATTEWSTCNALFDDGNQVIISNTNKYYVTFKYCAQEPLVENAYFYMCTGQLGNAWAKKSNKVEFEKAGQVSIEYPITATTEVGRWYTGALILDTSKIFVYKEEDGGSGNPREYAAVYMWLRGGGSKIAIDDVTFKKLPEGHQAYIVDNGGATSVPKYVSGRVGTSFRNQLPRNPQYENHIFKNYFRYDSAHNQAVLEDKDMVFTNDQISLVTNWVRLHTVQDFERYSIMKNALGAYGPADFDYKLYDAKAEGNSADNVTSGRYSIHRLGNTAYFENIQILDDDLRICGDEKFTVTMKVKIGKHFHTDGAIKIVGCRASTYSWATSGSYHPIAVIADIADGEWHEVSYTFSSVERYLSIQTPGYVEVFIDDVVIDRADPEMPVSTPPEFTEYVQALRDENGNLIEMDVSSIDVGSIIDFSIYIDGFNIVPVIIIVGGVLLIAGAVFAVLFVIKKRKAKKV